MSPNSQGSSRIVRFLPVLASTNCVRILFGDLDAYLDKQSTCARTRPFGQQKLGAKFYQKEHTKPIFNRLKVLTVQGLYKYFSITEIFKILKLRCPYSLFSSINISNRDASNAIILPEKSNTFLFRAPQLWNSVQKRIIPSNNGLNASINLVKLRTKAILLEAQSSSPKDQWTPHNFQIPPQSSTTTTTPHEPKSNEVINIS